MKSWSSRYYTAREAQIKLGMSKAKFHKWVRQGLIPRVILPGMKQGVYVKRDVDALALSLSEPHDIFEFSPSSPADSAEEINIARKHADYGTIFPLSERLIFQQKTKFAFYSLKVRDQTVGYIAMLRLSDEMLDGLLTGRKIIQDIHAVDILPFVRLEPFRVYFDTIAVDSTLSFHQRRLYAGTILYQTAELLFQLRSNDYEITGLYTLPSTAAGEQLAQKLGFQPLENRSFRSRRKAYEYLLHAEGLQRLQKMHMAYHRHRQSWSS